MMTAITAWLAHMWWGQAKALEKDSSQPLPIQLSVSRVDPETVSSFPDLFGKDYSPPSSIDLREELLGQW